MNAAAAGDRRPPLVVLYQRWSALLAHHVPPQALPLLRLERGAGLVRADSAEVVGVLMDTLLAMAAPRLYLPAPALPGVSIRPKIRAALSAGGAGLTADVRYFGVAPADAELRAAFAWPGSRVCPLPPLTPESIAGEADRRGVLAPGEVCLRALWPGAARRIALVRVLAGRRRVALPMAAVARAVSEDDLERALPHTCSLAQSLDEEPVPAADGRPAVLLLRRRGAEVALRIEALLGHSVERVLPVGPMLALAPWLLGIVDDDAAPVPVVDPLALPAVAATTEVAH